jgi:hypothetical protein
MIESFVFFVLADRFSLNTYIFNIVYVLFSTRIRLLKDNEEWIKKKD